MATARLVLSVISILCGIAAMVATAFTSVVLMACLLGTAVVFYIASGAADIIIDAKEDKRKDG